MKINVKGLTEDQQAQIVLEMYKCAKKADSSPFSQFTPSFVSAGAVGLAYSASKLQTEDDMTIDCIKSCNMGTKNDEVNVIIIDRLKSIPIKTTKSKRGGVFHLDFCLYEREYGADALNNVYKNLSDFGFLKDRIFAVNPDRELRLAAKEGCLAEVKMLIEDDGAKPNALAKNGRTALHFAVSNNHPDVVGYLAPQTNCEIADNKGDTVLDIATRKHFKAMSDVFALLDATSETLVSNMGDNAGDVEE